MCISQENLKHLNLCKRKSRFRPFCNIDLTRVGLVVVVAPIFAPIKFQSFRRQVHSELHARHVGAALGHIEIEKDDVVGVLSVVNVFAKEGRMDESLTQRFRTLSNVVVFFPRRRRQA